MGREAMVNVLHFSPSFIFILVNSAFILGKKSEANNTFIFSFFLKALVNVEILVLCRLVERNYAEFRTHLGHYFYKFIQISASLSRRELICTFKHNKYENLQYQKKILNVSKQLTHFNANI